MFQTTAHGRFPGAGNRQRGPVALPSRLRTVAMASATGLIAGTMLLPRMGTAAEPAASLDATYKDIEQTLGKVPGFVHQVPKAALPGAWSEVKALEFSDNTALPPKVKALISLAVSAQIPCQYCIWEDTMGARQAGATDQEIQEAVTIAALARHWSTILNGMQVDFETFKKDLGGDTEAARSGK
jgi:AhpD family alkylhydroperoxidase